MFKNLTDTKQKRIILAVVVAVFFLVILCCCCAVGIWYFVASHPGQPVIIPGSSQNWKISLQRTACFGFCPTYTVTVDSNGNVTFEPESNVNVTDVQTYTVDAVDIRRLSEAIVAADLERKDTAYVDPQITDIAGMNITYSDDNFATSIRMYGLDSTIPKDLTYLATVIDDVANTAQFTKGQRMMMYPEDMGY